MEYFKAMFKMQIFGSELFFGFLLMNEPGYDLIEPKSIKVDKNNLWTKTYLLLFPLDIEKLESVESESVIESNEETHSGIDSDLLRFGVSFGCALHFNLRIEECEGVVKL